MTLPGKVAICYLEEDVPQKAYFRVKPLFVKDEGSLIYVDNANELLPDEGGIRIVPDKNESSRFKARMRTLGSFCLLDLTGHPNENDKIRPNKNYSPEKLENNRNIVYSDVIERCPAEWLMEAVRVDTVQDGCAKAFPNRKIGTEHVCLIADGVISCPYVYTVDENGEYTFTRDEAYELRTLDEKAATNLISISPAQEKIEILLARSGASLVHKVEQAGLCGIAEPQKEEKEEKEPAAQPEKADAQPVPAIAAAEEKPAAPIAPPPPAKEPEPEKTAESEPAKIEKSRPRTAQRTEAQNLQTGLNPRRGRSLAEVVDDGWRKSRMDQFGAPVPVNVTGMPVVSPVEHAADSLRKAWALKEARANLAREILALDDFAFEIAPYITDSDCGAPALSQSEKLNALVAEKLRILTEIDEIRLRRVEKRAELMEEIRRIHASEIKKMEEAVSGVNEYKNRALREAENAREALEKAKKLLKETVSDGAKSDFIELLMASRASCGAPEADTSEYAHAPETYQPNGAQLVSDVRMLFEKAGKKLSNDEAVNLLAILALGKFIVFSGSTGVGKTALAGDLANALGLTRAGAKRFAALDDSASPALESSAFRALTQFDDLQTLRILLMDDANNKEALSQTRGLIRWFEENSDKSSLRVIMTVMDDQLGHPVNPRIWDRAFMLRLNASESGWNKCKCPVEIAEKTVSLESLSKIFDTTRDVPAEIEDRLQTLLEKLRELNVHISERTLQEMHAYCAAVLPYMTVKPIEILDYALSQRALPFILATAKMEVLEKLPELLCDLPKSLSLMNHPLPLPPME